jgi:hypothetical protein
MQMFFDRDFQADALLHGIGSSSLAWTGLVPVILTARNNRDGAEKIKGAGKEKYTFLFECGNYTKKVRGRFRQKTTVSSQFHSKKGTGTIF